MKKAKFFYGALLCLAALFALMAWLVPFRVIAELPDTMSLTEQEAEAFAGDQPFGRFVNTEYNKSGGAFELKLFNLVPIKTIEASIAPPTRVYLGGQVVGFAVENDGIIVLGSSVVQTKDGPVNALAHNELVAGDIIKSVNGERVTTANSLSDIINRFYGTDAQADNGTNNIDAKNRLRESDKNVDNAVAKRESKGETQIAIKAVRKNKEIEVKLKPAMDVITKKYKLGLWVRDDATGIGTLTYVREDNLRYGALGHPISDSATGVAVDARAGMLYPCEIMGVSKGGRGVPGELRGLVLKGRSQQGNISKNNKYGVFGDVKSDSSLVTAERLIEVGGRSLVKPGKAKIHSCIDGEKIEEFDIEIIKTNYQTHSNEKSLVFKITDKGLLKRTGGVVQGMSGSPIVQDNKLVGAVTHVFVNDPTKGFGIYIDWMINE